MPLRTKPTGHPGHQTSQGYVSTEFEMPEAPDYVIAELRYESPVAFTTTRFAAPAAAEPQAAALNRVLSKYDIAAVRSHFGKKISEVRERIEVAGTLATAARAAAFADKGFDADFIHSGVVQIVPHKSSNAGKLARELTRQKAVWQAYVAPRPVPAITAGPTPA